jgi:hypothetical protein
LQLSTEVGVPSSRTKQKGKILEAWNGILAGQSLLNPRKPQQHSSTGQARMMG